MPPQNPDYCEITVTLPRALVEYADREALRTSETRADVIARALAQARRARRAAPAAGEAGAPHLLVGTWWDDEE